MKSLIYILSLSLYVYSFIGCKQQSEENTNFASWAAAPETIEGSYSGEFPCEDCQAKIISIKIDMDQSVIRTVAHVGGSERAATTKLGSWSLNKESEVLTLEFGSGTEKQYFKVAQDQLTLMDSETASKPKKEAKKYILTKE